ncbi:molybdate ABC transporter substrate-binding protein [Aestuariirhabdus sp. LZHN29]|uniref:molybdate ABC transporter substrate-binding protein n=1 Tax=Aestuariirhabdus sp. LZHN29 TaxID=3417462 RepID=UPI003CF05B31
MTRVLIRKWWRASLRGGFALVALLLALPVSADAPLVAAASSLKFALEEIGQQYRAQRGLAVRFVFGSSGNFYRQIRQGAPYQIFLSADEEYVQLLESVDLVQLPSFIYSTGRLAYFAPAGSSLNPELGMDDLRRAVTEQRLNRFAIANPAHAPYGRAALEVLQQLGVEAQIKPHLVLGENVSQAAQFAVSGSTDGGLIAYSLALSPQLSARGSFRLVPAELHAPLRQRAAVIKGAGEDAQQFFDYLQTDQAQATFARYGFSQ